MWVVIHNGDDGYGGVTGPFETREEAIESVLTDPGVVDYAWFELETHPDCLTLGDLPVGFDVEDPDPMGGWTMRTDIWNWQVRQLNN